MIQNKTLWDRKSDGGFPETKELKRRVRDVISPDRNLGHVDRDYGSSSGSSSKKPTTGAEAEGQGKKKTECADCENLTEETYGDVEGGHEFGGSSGSGSGKTETVETVGELGKAAGAGGSGSGESGKKAADANWMSGETYKDFEH